MQATIATSMTASVLLESHTTLPEVADISVMRFMNTGPSSALFPITRAARSSPVLAIVAVALAMSSTILQFTSTILVSDLDTTPGLTLPKTEKVKVAFETKATAQVTNTHLQRYWSYPPNFFPSFAEYNHRNFSTSSNTLKDTGITIRGFFPLTLSDNRTMLRNYLGHGTLLDMRVACTQPVLQNLSLKTMDDYNYNYYLSGTAASVSDIHLLYPPPEPTVHFDCLINQYNFGSSDLNTPSYTLCPLLNPTDKDTLYPGLGSPLNNNTASGSAYLLINHTGVAGGLERSSSAFTTTSDGVWTQIGYNSEESPESGPRVTMCFNSV